MTEGGCRWWLTSMGRWQNTVQQTFEKLWKTFKTWGKIVENIHFFETIC
jgi:hypothetical protein